MEDIAISSRNAVEDKDIQMHVPGTELLIDLDGHINLQHAKVGDGHVLLVPQPSLVDPNDPLSWPLWKKWMVFANALTYSFLGSNFGPLMSGGMVEQSAAFGIPISHLSWAAGIALLASGVATMFWVPLFIKYGRRPVFLSSTITTGALCMWCGYATKTSFASFFVARALAGWCIGPIESITATTITDIFFLHDRGEKISYFGLSVLGGNEIGPIISAYIIQSIGIRWAFYILGIALFANFIAIFFTMPESNFWGQRPDIDLALATKQETSATAEKGSATSQVVPSDKSTGENDNGTSPVEQGSIEQHVPKRPYVRELHPFPVVNSTASLRKLFLRPIVLASYPTVLWASAVYGMALTWNVVLALTVAQLFAPPPYLFGSGALGLIFLSPAIGSLVATYLCGPLADQIATIYTRRNNGVREPEMRLSVAYMSAFFTFAGVAIAGPCYHYQTHWIGPIFGFGVLSLGAQMAANLAMTYCLDSHKELSGEVMTTISVIKSTLAWTWSWFINDWIILNGMMTVYLITAAINIVVLASTFLMYFYGKDIRIRLQRQNLLGRLNLL